ncbi:hypothetical protein CRENBAI_017625 [Crenichthys baileyi]|uniref:Uncharacterized protein n=1 Tax=Crenichthys baileyi TaxID=28760 RepID=A0AAV9RXJ6_9TELE
MVELQMVSPNQSIWIGVCQPESIASVQVNVYKITQNEKVFVCGVNDCVAAGVAITSSKRGSHDPVSGGSGVSERRLTDNPKREASCVPSQLDLSSFLPSLSLSLLCDPSFLCFSCSPLHCLSLALFSSPVIPSSFPHPFSTHPLFHPIS